MKLILAIINNDDAGSVSSALTKQGFFATKLATTGGFLKAGNTTFLIGVEDTQVNKALKIISKYSSKRGGIIPEIVDYAPNDFGTAAPEFLPTEITVGGATVFVLNIERFEKL